MVVSSWTHEMYLYIDDFGRTFMFPFTDYIGDAGGLKRAYPDPPPGVIRAHTGFRTRLLKLRSTKPVNGKKVYKEIPVNVDNPLWTGNLGQIVMVGGYEMETIKRIEEKEYGRAGAAEERRQLKKYGINPYFPIQELKEGRSPQDFVVP